MILEIVFILAGVTAGVVTGLIPGLHANLVSAVLLGMFPSYPAVVFVVSLAVTHTVVDAISISILRAGNDDIVAAVPSTVNAAKLMIEGSAAGLITSLLLAPALWFVLPALYGFVKPATAPLLIIALLILIIREPSNKLRMYAMIVVFLSGLLGLAALSKNLNEPLLPLLSGLFGIPGLLFENSKTSKIEGRTTFKKILFSSLLGVLASGMLLLLPSLGPGQAAQLISPLIPNGSTYLSLVGGINTIDFVLSTLMAATTGNSRNGSLELSSRIVSLNAHLLGIIAVAGGLSILIGLLLLKIKFVPDINFKLGIIVFISLLTLWFDQLSGVLILITSSMIGSLALKSEVNRTHCMACLIIPTITYFL